jgi:hypothetical protein
LGPRTNFAFVSAQFFQSDAQAYRTTLKLDFRPDPPAFQLLQNLRQ